MNAAAAGSPSSGPEDLVFTPFPKDRYDRDLSSFFESGEAYVTVDSQHEEDVMGPPCAAPTAIDIRHRRIGSPAAPLELGKRMDVVTSIHAWIRDVGRAQRAAAPAW